MSEATMTNKTKFARLFGLLVALIAWPTISHAEDFDCLGTPSDTRLVILVENVRSLDGVIRFTVYPDDPERFLQAGGPMRDLSHLPVPVAMPVTEACIWLPGPGGYALSIFHDDNDNGEMDDTWIGLPAEGFGFSNNPRLFGRPRLEQVLFEVPTGDLTINIRLRYVG